MDNDSEKHVSLLYVLAFCTKIKAKQFFFSYYNMPFHRTCAMGVKTKFKTTEFQGSAAVKLVVKQ